MKDVDINVLLQKSAELKSLFLVGKDLIPVLEEIFIFIKEIQPIIEEINTTLTENLKKMPTASEQLSKVSEANEIATSQIIEIVEKMTERVDFINNNKQAQKAENTYHLSLICDFLDEMKSEIEPIENLGHLVDKIDFNKNTLTDYVENQLNNNLSDDVESLNGINADLFSILMSLQVQDITTQQLASVNHSIQAIQVKLIGMVNLFQNSRFIGSSDIELKDDVTKFHREVAFDPHAVDSMKNVVANQSSIDAVFNNENLSGETISVHEIDDLFK